MSLAARLRLTLMMTLAVYPVVTLYLYILMPLTDGWTIWQRSLILVPMMSATIVLVVVPFINRRFGAFIAGRRPAL
jgi:antibiotic biosynthesis monooxygenase (ABM) superfamily enzyme